MPPAIVHHRRGRYVAFYSQRILDNGWQPYDQPSPGAYMPLAFDKFDHYPCRGGLVLVERKKGAPK